MTKLLKEMKPPNNGINVAVTNEVIMFVLLFYEWTVRGDSWVNNSLLCIDESVVTLLVEIVSNYI